MDDSETEARRLLAVATTDMPPGIDLLEGFAAARQRDRARRTRRIAVLSAGIAVAAALVTALTLTTAGSAPSARAAVTSALTRTLTQSYHLTEQDSSYYISNGRVTHGPHDTCTSVADPVRHLEATSCPNGAMTRTVGRYRYDYYADPARQALGPDTSRMPRPSRPHRRFHHRHTTADAGRDQEGRQGHRGRARLGAWVDRHPVRVQQDNPSGEEETQTQGYRGPWTSKDEPGHSS